MAILKVARLGHPVLRQVADPIPPADISSPEIQRLIADMLDTVDEYDGAGLAAPQVHESVRLVVLQIDDATGMQVWINPVLTPLTEEVVHSFEGCLSVPDMRGLVGRYSSVQVDALERDGSPVHLVLEGFPAIVAQHECDHLDGVVYVDIAEVGSLSFMAEYRRFGSRLFDDDEDDFEDEDEDVGDDPTDAQGDAPTSVFEPAEAHTASLQES